MPDPVVHWEIVSSEHGKELQQFYTDLFGWQIDADNPLDYGMVDTQASGSNGGIGPTEGLTRVTIYIQADDIQVLLDRAVSLSGAQMMPVSEIIRAG